MNIDIIHEPSRVYVLGSSGSMVAEITFPQISPGRVNFNHTYVSPSLRGKGVAHKMIRAAVNDVRAAGLKAVATCPFAVKWFGEHPEEGDVLAE
ncbi:MAG: N-acetyltransferase [Clostridiales bacterium]|jgi:predicted GNAT family acetyltransferase|nr:N-acetyltransferase [Clostridiales bacterium]